MRLRHVVQLLALLVMSVCVYTNFSLDARATAISVPVGHKHSGQSPGQAETLRVLVDGAKNPEAISDELAYRLFLTALAFPATVPPERVRARDALLARLGLSKEDRAAFVSGSNGLAEQLQRIELERNVVAKQSNLSAEARAEYASLRAKRNEAVAAVRARLEGTLSGEGLTTLDHHIRTHVTQRVKIYGE